MTGIAAAVIFPTIKGMNPVVPSYQAYDGEHWRLIAGRTANAVFLWSDTVQFVCAVIGLASLIVVLIASGAAWRRVTLGVRTVGFATALSLFSYSFFILRTQMNTELTRYWAAAESGDNAAAETHRLAFAEMHPQASALIAATAFAVLITLVAGMIDLTRDRSRPGRTGTPPVAPAGYEEPSLSKGRR